MKGLVMGSAAVLGRRSLLRTGRPGGRPDCADRSRYSGNRDTHMQLGWLGGGNQLGEASCPSAWIFPEEGLDFHVQPGGPNNDGIAIVASGRYEVGEAVVQPVADAGSIAGHPIRCFAVSAQKHPYTFFSLQKNPSARPRTSPARRPASRRPA